MFILKNKKKYDKFIDMLISIDKMKEFTTDMRQICHI